MTNEQAVTEFHKLKFAAGINAKYHQKLSFFWNVCDRCTRIAVGIVSIVGLILSHSGVLYANWSSRVEYASLAVAFALNVIEFNTWFNKNEDLFRRFNDLFGTARELEDCVINSGKAKPTEIVEDRLSELKKLEVTLDGCQSARVMWLWKICETEQLMETYGVDTYEKAYAKFGTADKVISPC